MSMHRYYIVADTQDGDSVDLFVDTTTEADAVAMWQKYYGDIHKDTDMVRIMMLPPMASSPQVVAWNLVVVK
jgi:hypothetical protein